jgi:hypothetical protein
MVEYLVNKSDFNFDPLVTRRECVKIALCSCCLLFTRPLSIANAAVKTKPESILDRFLGEELFFHIGYWLIPHCGEAQTDLVQTDIPNIYRASLQGRTVGIVDALVGRLRYSYVSYSQFVENEDRLRPIFFQIIRKRAGKERHRYITFDYKAGGIIFSKIGSDAKSKVRRETLQAAPIYEDYLTLGYNLRHGKYGIPETGKDYQLPLYVTPKKKTIKLYVASTAEAQKQHPDKSIRIDKDFLLTFQVDRKDLSSGSGEVELWVTPEIMPISGRIKDVAFFGDLWGNLIVRKFLDPNRIYSIPDNVKNRLPIP